MTSFSTSVAILRVRKNLDEIDPNGSIMYYPASSENKDNTSLDDIIKRNLPEAINAVHLSAPVTVLSGTDATFDGNVSVDKDGVMGFKLTHSAGEILRMVEFKAKDSDIVVTDVLEEASPEGRKQLNKYIRGRSDRPRLVRTQKDKDSFLYYSVTGNGSSTETFTPSTKVDVCRYILAVKYNLNGTDADPSYSIDSPKIEQNIIDYLTGMVLETYTLPEKAKVFYERSTIFHQ